MFGDDDDGEHIPVEEHATQEMEDYFGDVLGENGGNDDGDSENSGDEAWRDDVIPERVSDDEDEQGSNSNMPVAEEEDEETILKLGKCFASATDFKQALLRYSLKTQYDIKLYVSNAFKLGAVCSDKEGSCPWRVYCSYDKRKKKLQIKIFESKHTCIRSGYTTLLKCSTIAQLFDEKLRVDPKFRAVDMAAEIKDRYNLIVTVEQCRKAKSKLSRDRRKIHEEQFARIWDYEAELHKSNQGTIVEIQTVPGTHPGSLQRFDRIFICFEAQRAAWRRNCRPVIGLDGAFLKWDIKGQLLAAVGRDGDNRIVPIAWAVVEIENDVNWDWFVSHLQQCLGLGDGANYTIISNKEKGLVEAIATVLPKAEHRRCARHVLHNWKREGSNMELERMFWKIARSYTMGDFNDNMTVLMQTNKVAYDALLRTKPETWSRAFHRAGSCCNDILNNLSESFNKTLQEARRKPLLDLLEDIRRQCMVRIAKRAVLSARLKIKFTKSAH